MAKLTYKNGVASVVIRFKFLDTSSATGAGLTGKDHTSAGLRLALIADNEATSTVYTSAGSTVESLTTLGTFAAPTSGKVRFKEVDAVNHPGIYEVQAADARWAVSGARSVILTGQITGGAQQDSEVQLVTDDPYVGKPANFASFVIDASGRVDVGQWIGQIPAALSATGKFLQAMVLRWKTDDAGGTPNALVSGNLPVDVKTIKTVDADTALDARTTAALIALGFTSARAGYLDNLNVGGLVASSAEALAIQNNTRVVRVVPPMLERPDTGSTVFRIEVLCYDGQGAMEVPDSAPTVGVVNQAGTSRDANLDSTTMALVSAGRYRATYTIDTAHAIEELIFAFSVVEGGQTRVYVNGAQVVDTTAVDFTSTDRTTLNTLAATAALEASVTAIKGAGWTNENIKSIYDRIGVPVGASISADLAAKLSTANFNTAITALKGAGWTDESIKGIFDRIGSPQTATLAQDVATRVGSSEFDIKLAARTLLAANYATAAGVTGVPAAVWNELYAGMVLSGSIGALVVTISQRIGNFGGSLSNDIKGYLTAMMRADATVPTGIGGTYNSATDALQAIRDRGDAEWTNNPSGSGDHVVTITVEDEDGNGIPNAIVTVQGEAGTNQCWGRSNQSGVLVFNLNDGDYSAIVHSVREYENPAPEAFTVDGVNISVTIVLVAHTPTPPPSPGLCTVTVNALGPTGELMDGCLLTAVIDGPSMVVDLSLVTLQVAEATITDGSGELLLIREDQFVRGTGRYRFTATDADGKVFSSFRATIPNQDSCDLVDLLMT